MNKPNGYDEVQAQGEFIPVNLGGHYMVIKQVSEKKTNDGTKDMVVVLFDFDSNDEQAEYFMNQFKNDTRQDKKYPNQATQYIITTDADGKTSRSFKTFTTCVEHSNAGFETKWGIADWGKQFVGKKIGGVFGEQLDYYNGEIKKKRVLRWFTSVDKVAIAMVPDISESKAYKNRPADGSASSNDGFMNIPDGIDEELPFN